MAIKKWIGIIGACFFLFSNTVSAAVIQTPWQTGAAGWLKTGLNWPGYNTGYEFIPQQDGYVVQLGGLFSGTKWVRLYAANGTLLAQTQVTDNYQWGYTDIAPVPVQAGQTYTVAVETGFNGSTMYYGPGFPNMPRLVGDVQIKQGVFGFGTGRPTAALWGQMWGQADVGFTLDPGAGSTVEVVGVFPGPVVTIDSASPTPNTANVYLNITNHGADPLVYDFTSTQHFDIWVINSIGEVVSQWSWDQYFFQFLNSVTIMPNEMQQFGDAVKLAYADGTPLPPGFYKLRIELTGTQQGAPAAPVPSAEADIEINWQ